MVKLRLIGEHKITDGCAWSAFLGYSRAPIVLTSIAIVPHSDAPGHSWHAEVRTYVRS
jgi:hypothetical protein